MMVRSVLAFVIAAIPLKTLQSAAAILVVEALVALLIIGEVKHRASVIVPKDNPDEYRQLLEALTPIMIDKGYVLQSQTPSLSIYRKKSKLNIRLAVLIVLLFEIPVVLYLLFGGIDSSVAVRVIENLASALPLAFAGLIPALVYLLLTGEDRAIFIQVFDLPQGYYVGIQAPGWIYNELKRVLLPYGPSVGRAAVWMQQQ